MPPDNVRQLPSAVPVFVSPEVVAAREELAILHDVFASMSTATMPAKEHERAKRTLDYLHALLVDAQARHDALLSPAATQAPATDAAPAIASKEPEQSAPAAS